MKLNYIDWYLVELRRRLLDSMPLDQESSFILETKNHLESLTEEFVQNGMDPRAAEIAAIERFGSPDKIASECLMGLRRSRERKLIFGAGIVLAVLILMVTWSASFGHSRWLPYGFLFASSYLPLVVGFVVFAFILGKMPTWKWFAFPLICILVFGTLSGVKNSSLSVRGYGSLSRPYGELHEQFVQLQVQDILAAKTEHEAAESWRQSIAEAKDLKAGATIEIARLEYQSQRNGNTAYVSNIANSRQYFQSLEFGQGQIMTDLYSSKTSFQYLPKLSKLPLKGPLTSHDIRLHIQGRLTEAQTNVKLRSEILGNYRTSLSIPVASRVKSIVGNQAGIYLIEIAPFALVLSFFFAKIRNRIRFRDKSMRLA